MPALSRVPEVRPPASNTTTPHSTSMTLHVVTRDFKTTQRIDMLTRALFSSCPADVFRPLKHACALSRCGGTLSRVQLNLQTHLLDQPLIRVPNMSQDVISRVLSAQTCRVVRRLARVKMMLLGYSNMPALCRVAEVRPPASNTTSTHLLAQPPRVPNMSQDVISNVLSAWTCRVVRLVCSL